MKNELWFCEACEVEGCIEIQDHADLLDVMDALAAAHRGVRSACHAQNRLHRMRVRSPHCTKAEWAQATKTRKDIALPERRA